MENLKRYAYLIGAISLYSLKVTIFKVLKEKNKVLFNPCNVLCASQAIGLISSVIFLRRDLTSEKLKTIPTNIWKWMLLGNPLLNCWCISIHSWLRIKNKRRNHLCPATSTVRVHNNRRTGFIVLHEGFSTFTLERSQRYDHCSRHHHDPRLSSTVFRRHCRCQRGRTVYTLIFRLLHRILNYQ